MDGVVSEYRDGEWPVLCRVWARNYEAGVIVSVLRDAGIDAMLDCDPRGPMYYYYFPFGSSAPAPIYVPADQTELARELLGAELIDNPWLEEEPFAFDSARARIDRRRHVVFTAWLLSSFFGAIGLVFGLLAQVVGRRRPGDSGV